MARLKTQTKEFANGVKFLSRSTDFGFKVDDALDNATKDILLNIETAVKLSFTKNFDAKAPTNKKEADTLAAFGRSAATSLKNQSPIDSGDLQGSVKGISTGRNTGEVEMKQNYAIHVEFGTVYMPPRPVFRYGVRDAAKENDGIIVDELFDIRV
jgi:HK97 gp10 family phage protein